MEPSLGSFFKAGFRPLPEELPPTACLRINNLLEEITTHPLLGQPILRAIPHPSCPDLFNPDISQFILSYDKTPDASMCICYGNGPLDKLLADEGFKKHVNDHVRDVTRHITNPCGAIDVYSWRFTEYVLGLDGETSVMDGRDTRKLSPLVREALRTYQDRKFSAAGNKQSGESATIPFKHVDRPISTSHNITGINFPSLQPVITPSATRSPYPPIITEEIKSLLHGKYEEYGDPIFRRISNPSDPGSSQIKLNFTKIPGDQLQLSCDFHFDGDGDRGDGQVGINEEQMLADITRQVKRTLLGNEEGERKGEVNTPVKAFKKRNARVKRRGDRGQIALNATSMEEVDQEIETIAVRSQYWNYSPRKGGEDGGGNGEGTGQTSA